MRARQHAGAHDPRMRPRARTRAQVSSAWTAALRQRSRTPSGALGLPCFEPDAASYPYSVALPPPAHAKAADGRWGRRGGGDGGGVAAAMAIARLLNPTAPPDQFPGDSDIGDSDGGLGLWGPAPPCLGW